MSSSTIVPSMHLYVVPESSNRNPPGSNEHSGHNDSLEASDQSGASVPPPVFEGNTSGDSFDATEELGPVEYNSNVSSSYHTEEGDQLQLSASSSTPVQSPLTETTIEECDAIVDAPPNESGVETNLPNESSDTFSSSVVAPDSAAISNMHHMLTRISYILEGFLTNLSSSFFSLMNLLCPVNTRYTFVTGKKSIQRKPIVARLSSSFFSSLPVRGDR
ncbi:hypothetical protein V6N11_062377 [Hibiscus sabdariffa]|uniref:Uncharacterized protein n=1 Tax=Hibiscus sabdariffa TaxID=183260 RepID=A0ABR2PSC4_9ROSI